MKTNRIEDGDHVPAARTPAQQEASRRNGALSRGPTTAAGKARSARNALKHGVFARKIMPPGDPREHDRLYDHARHHLAQQFDPQTFTEHAAVDGLAADYVQRARVYRMIEAIQKPAGVTDEDIRRWHQLQEARAEVELLSGILAELDAGEELHCTLADAEHVARAVAEFVRRVMGEAVQAGLRPPTGSGKRTGSVADADDEDPDGLDFDDGEVEDWEVEELEAELALIGRSHRRLSEVSFITDVLTGDRDAKPVERKRLRAIVEHLREQRRAYVEQGRELESGLQAAEERTMAKLAGAPEEMLLLHRYLREIERAIERKIESLGG